MNMHKRTLALILAVCGILALAVGSGDRVQAQAPGQAVDESGAPIFKVDPFWPKPLPMRWSMQQVTGIHVDHMDHIWFLNGQPPPKAMKSVEATSASSAA